MILTIFTPTYNRAASLKRTFNSLLNQTCKDFEWLIVDDGSTDDTQNLISQWESNSPFPIHYFRQENCGKYRAYNAGLQHAMGDLFICIDSDDWMPKDSVERILSHKSSLFADDKFAGIIALKEYPNKEIIGTSYPEAIHRSSLYQLEKKGYGGERSLLFKTGIAKQFLFPEKTNEKFITESVIYDRYENLYEFLVCNEVLTTCEYQDNGLSSNPRKLMLNNPAGYKLYFAQRVNLEDRILYKIKYAISYNAFAALYKGSYYDYQGPHRFLIKIMMPLGLCLAYYYKYKTK